MLHIYLLFLIAYFINFQNKVDDLCLFRRRVTDSECILEKIPLFSEANRSSLTLNPFLSAFFIRLFPSLAFTLLPSSGPHFCLFPLDSQASGSFLILRFKFSQDFRHESWEPCSQIQVLTRTRKLTQMT